MAGQKQTATDTDLLILTRKERNDLSALFFADKIEKVHTLYGEDASHIARSLRMTVGEIVTFCTPDGMCHDCEITNISKSEVDFKVVNEYICESEPSIEVTLYQALTKSDKMDLIIQKSVELGVGRIVPVITDRCVSRPDAKSMDKKIERWQKIAKNAAMQSRRGKVPMVMPLLTLENAAKDASALEKAIVYYEKYGENTNSLITVDTKSLGIFVGSEGGFSEDDIRLLEDNGISCASLGKRILRTETAPLAALTIIMYITENM